MTKINNLTGQRFGKLTVVRRSSKKSANGSYLWECHCDCGNDVTRTRSALKSNDYSSCGKCGRKAYVDLTGKRFGKLYVIKREGSTNGKRKIPLWLCRCDCGNTCLRTASHLKANYINTCGSCPNSRSDLVGKKYGRWTVLEKVERKNRKLSYLCKCDCGKIKAVNADSLLSGRSLSCGCLQKAILSERETTHGMTHTRIYNIYHNMKNRCYNLNDRRYKDYGGRGINICPEWLGEHGFDNFYNWSIKNGYTDSLTIDRINVNGNYEPNNCRWSTNAEQANNKRNSIYFTFFGITKNLKEWCDVIGENYGKMYGRYHRGYETFRGKDINKIEQYLKNGGK